MKRGPAPLSRSSLQAVVSPGVGDSLTLPAEAYNAAGVLEWERENLFAGGWVCAGRSDAVQAHNGAVNAVELAGERVLLTRDESGVFHGFYNTCRHRGHELVPSGEWRGARAITCPYHAWSYELDGKLRSAPHFGNVPGFDPADYSLVPVRTATWRGWCFVNLSDDSAPLTDNLGSLDSLVAPWEPERLCVAATHTYDVHANWKTIVENFHECYHCPSIHPELCAVTDLASGGNLKPDGLWLGGPMSLKANARTMSLSGASEGVRLPGLSDAQARQLHYYCLFPNLLISLFPDYAMTHRLQPVDETQTEVECSWLFPPEAMRRPGFDPAYAVDFWDRTNRQDWQACESVARGLRSRGFRPGPMTWKEDGVHAFMAMIAGAYLTGTVSRPDTSLERPPHA